jgi:hypothetical protein
MNCKRLLALLRAISTAWAILVCSLPAGAYVGELSKDSNLSGLPPQEARHRAYGMLMQFLSTAEAEAEMPQEVLRAYRLLRNADEQVLMEVGKVTLNHILDHLRVKLAPAQWQMIEGYSLRVTAATDEIALVDRSERKILIPVAFLHEVWTVTMAFEEAGAMQPPAIVDATVYAAFRINSRFRLQRANQAYNAMGLTKALHGRNWNVSRDKWNEALSSAYQTVKGAVVQSALHEICHVIAGHKDYGEVSAARSMQQEREADLCAGPC